MKRLKKSPEYKSNLYTAHSEEALDTVIMVNWLNLDPEQKAKWTSSDETGVPKKRPKKQKQPDPSDISDTESEAEKKKKTN